MLGDPIGRVVEHHCRNEPLQPFASFCRKLCFPTHVYIWCRVPALGLALMSSRVCAFRLSVVAKKTGFQPPYLFPLDT